ncbi:MAG TPA: GNAT family N-acetyltransferase [Longimicrobiales bacterium]
MPLTLSPLEPRHWDAVREIYRQGIASGNATFETDPGDWDAWDAAHLPECRIVAALDGQVVGWAALSPVSRRFVYRGVAEVSVYVADGARGRGVGSALLAAVIAESERLGFWTLQGGIFPENTASRALVRKHGFREVGVRERIGEMNGVWRDVILVERRSRTVGTGQAQPAVEARAAGRSAALPDRPAQRGETPDDARVQHS